MDQRKFSKYGSEKVFEIWIRESFRNMEEGERRKSYLLREKFQNSRMMERTEGNWREKLEDGKEIFK
jgi:hypothetical protein